MAYKNENDKEYNIKSEFLCRAMLSQKERK